MGESTDRRTDSVAEPLRSNAGIVDLIHQLRDDLARLVRLELRLPRVEFAEMVADAMRGAGFLVAGGLLALGSLVCLLAATITGLHAMFTAAGLGLHVALASACVVVAVGSGSVAALLFTLGRRRVGSERLKPSRTLEAARSIVVAEDGGTNAK